jgi:hypothetical protein
MASLVEESHRSASPALVMIKPVNFGKIIFSEAKRSCCLPEIKAAKLTAEH